MDTHVKNVGVGDFMGEVIERSHEVPVVVDFWAEWCGPCRTLGPMLEQAAEAGEGAFELAKVDVDQNQALASQFGVQGIPTVVGFRDGQAVNRFVGAVPQSRLDAWLSELVPSDDDKAVDVARDLLLAGDEEAAEEIYRGVLEKDPRHTEAGVGLASLLISSARVDEASEILDALPNSAEVERLRAAARLKISAEFDASEAITRLEENPGDHALRMELAQSQAAEGEHEQALGNWLIVVKEDPELREQARLLMLDVFKVLGADHPLTARYRRDLANALF
ncbi:MAG: thioredoxin [Acidimicrobiia bacterium]